MSELTLYKEAVTAIKEAILGVVQKGLFPGNSCAEKGLVAAGQAGMQSAALF